MRIIFLFLFVVSQHVHADFVAGAGLEVGRLLSDEVATNDSEVLSIPTLVGFKTEAEFGLPWFTCYAGFNGALGAARTQYDYVNSDNSSDAAQVEDLRTRATMSRIIGGARLKLIRTQRFRLFVGGSIQYGLLGLTYDKENFEDKNESSTGFEESERQKIQGTSLEAGLDFILDRDSGIRLIAQKSNYKSAKFETLGDQKLKLGFESVSAIFIQYVEMSK